MSDICLPRDGISLKKSNSNGIQFVTPPPANLFALTDPGGESSFDKVKSFISGIKYTFILTLMLWWLPLIGQCIAGYVGGRRAGSAYRGFLAAMVPVFVFLGISYFIVGDISSLENPGTAAVGDISASVNALLPFLVPYLNFSALYLGDFIGALQQTTQLKISIYTVVVVFAFIGGLMADQAKRELGTVFKAMVPINIKSQENVWSNKRPTKSFDSMKPVKAATGKTTKTSSSKTAKKNPKTGAALKKCNTLK